MMNKFPKVSIVIAANRGDSYLMECIGECLKLDYPVFDIIVLTDKFKSKKLLCPVKYKYN